MEHAQILDCTLRDGGYLVNKHFGDDNIHGIINGLVDTGIDIIELGFLQNEGFGEGNTVFLNSVDAEKFIPQNRKRSMFTAFADYSRYDVNNLDEYTGKSFEAVRACFFKKERYDVIEFCKKVQEKGYLLFVQPVDILGYSDAEIIELIESINEIEPYCFSIVDTFGSMYEEDLDRIFRLVNHNLISTCKIGFHSHNNLQMSNALSQAFLRYSYGKRNVIVDTTIQGMGRGAGNTPTELVVQYMKDKLGYSYDIDYLLDVIDNYMQNIAMHVNWGYSTPMYLAGSYSAHVNNIYYLKKKNSICSKDIRYILNELGMVNRKRYDYDLIDDIYMRYIASDIDDSVDRERLSTLIEGRIVVVIAGGKSIVEQREAIIDYINKNNAIVISINDTHHNIKSDFLYVSNIKKHQKNLLNGVEDIPCILTSNIGVASSENTYVFSLNKLIKCGWENMDNSAMLLLRLLDYLNVKQVALAGLDGYTSSENYACKENEVEITSKEADFINLEIAEMIRDFMKTKSKDMEFFFITDSLYKDVIA